MRSKSIHIMVKMRTVQHKMCIKSKLTNISLREADYSCETWTEFFWAFYWLKDEPFMTTPI